MFKVGDRVEIAEGSRYYGQSATCSNPSDCVGTVQRAITERFRGFLPVTVDWDNGTSNGYNHSDLKLTKEKGTMKEIKKEKSTNRKVVLVYADGKQYNFSRVKGFIVDTRTNQVKIDNTKTIDLITINQNTIVPFEYLACAMFEDVATGKRHAYHFEDNKVIASQETYTDNKTMGVKQH